MNNGDSQPGKEFELPAELEAILGAGASPVRVSASGDTCSNCAISGGRGFRLRPSESTEESEARLEAESTEESDATPEPDAEFPKRPGDPQRFD
jgi:hypothetical protein